MGLHNLSGCGPYHSIGLGLRESGNRCLKSARLHRTGIAPILAVLVPARGQTMVINGSRNKPFGPGGSTRRLHQGRFVRTGPTPYRSRRPQADCLQSASGPSRNRP